jgi:hypothetical protein
MKWTDYTTKETLKDNDELMILDKDANANKRTLMDKIWNYVVDKMTTAVIAKLGTTNKTLIGAVNELNSNALFTWKGELEEKVKNTLTISKSNPYSTVVVIISNNDSLFFYIDSTFRGEKIKDNPSCTVERIDNSKFRIIHNSYGKVLIFSVGSFNCSVTK